ncbi:MAG: hypothetical protein AB7D03_03745 [Thiomicrospira sp.]
MLELIDAYWLPVLLVVVAYNALAYRWAMADKTLFDLASKIGHDPDISSADFKRVRASHDVSLNCCLPILVLFSVLTGRAKTPRYYSKVFTEKYEKDFLKALTIRIAKRSPISFILLVVVAFFMQSLRFFALLLVAFMSFNGIAHAGDVPKNTASQTKTALYQVIGRHYLRAH